MRIRIAVTIDVDPEKLADTYGLTTAGEIRSEVRKWLINHVQQSAPADEGAITDARLS